MKITIVIPEGKYCESCPCLGLSGKEEEHCGFFNKSLSIRKGQALRHKDCLDMEKMYRMEGHK